MRTSRNVLAAIVVLALSVPVLAQQEQTTSPEMAAMMKAWEKAATPGPNHELLASFAGKWSFTTKFWMAPNTPPEESKGSMTSEMVMGGRYLVDRTTGEMMGQLFQGMGITGYDNVLGKFVSVWVDSSGTGIMTSEGTYDPLTKTMTMVGTYGDAMTGKPKQARMVTRIESETRHVMELFEAGPDGREYRTMEMVYTRE